MTITKRDIALMVSKTMGFKKSESSKKVPVLCLLAMLCLNSTTASKASEVGVLRPSGMADPDVKAFKTIQD